MTYALMECVMSLELEKTLNEFGTSMETRAEAVRLTLKNGMDSMDMDHEQLLTDLNDFKEQTYNSLDTLLIDEQQLQIDSLKGQIKALNLYIYVLEHRLEVIDLSQPWMEVANALNEKVMNAQEEEITLQTTKIDKYQNGPKKKSSDSQQKWTLANEYFKEEIPAHRTLKAARLTAAKRAGIVAEERQLNKKMPNPRQ
jgi:hypothetical protein